MLGVDEEIKRLEQIHSVRETKQLVARLQLVELAARASQAQSHATEAQQDAILTRQAAGVRIGKQRAEILGGVFAVNAMSELRCTIEVENVRCTSADKAAAQAAEVASRLEVERFHSAQRLLALESRCKRLDERLRELRSAEINARDLRAMDDFVRVIETK